MAQIKAVGLFSGGLDSLLALKLMKEQGIEVVAIHFMSNFGLGGEKTQRFAEKVAKEMGVQLKVMSVEPDYLKVLKKPKHGYGQGVNPCIDCHIYMLKKAKKLAREIGAKFVFTGEVLGQRPMSQHLNTLKLIEKEASLKGKLLRPLSAKLLPETEAEKKGWVDRSKLMAFEGRVRKPQMELAAKLGIKEYQAPAGGCLLTQKEFAAKVKDLLAHEKVKLDDLEILKLGRHFRLGKNKIIVGRNEKENEKLLKLKKKKDEVFEVLGVGSPVTLLQGKKSKAAREMAAKLTARYSDAIGEMVKVNDGKKHITVKKISEEEINKLRV